MESMVSRFRHWKSSLKKYIKQKESQPKARSQAASPTPSIHIQESAIPTSGAHTDTFNPQVSSRPISVKDVDVQPEPIQARLWNKAYGDLKRDNPDLVDAYEILISQELCKHNQSSSNEEPPKNEVDQTNSNRRQTQMQQIVQAGLDKTDREDHRMRRIQSSIASVSSIKDLISQSLKTVPEAAIAWTGVCFAFEMFSNAVNETVANRDGLAHVVSRMEWYWNLSHILNSNIGERTAKLKGSLETQIIDLYKNIFAYQMKSVLYFYKNRCVAFIRGTIKLDSWDDNMEVIKNADDQFGRDYPVYHMATNTEMHEIEGNNKCLSDLRVVDPRDDKTRIEKTKGGFFPESSNWILQHDSFRRWRDDDKAKILWIKGDPGKGKTMLMISIINELKELSLQKKPSSTALSYFFCQGTSAGLNNATAVLRGLIYLLGCENPSLVSHLRPGYDRSGKALFEDINAFYPLSEGLASMLRDESFSRVYLLIDALDECETQLPELLEFIVSVSSIQSRVKWIVSSRNNRSDIEQHLKLDDLGVKLGLELTENAEQVAQAVNAYIDYKVSKMPVLQGHNDTITEVQKVLHQKATGTFLWAALAIQKLETTKLWRMLNVLESLPPGLDKLYGRMMSQILALEGEDLKFCQEVLSVVILAYRPLRLEEIVVLAELPTDIFSNTEYVEEIVAMCASFLTIRDGYVYPVHQSVKDYFLEDAGSSALFLSGISGVHHSIFSRSVQAMSALRRNIYGLDHPGLLVSQIETPDPDPLAAIRYSCTYWINHFCDAYGSPEDQVRTDDVACIVEFIRSKFIYWLEALSLTRHVAEAKLSMTTLENLLRNRSSDHELLDLIHDSSRFLLQNMQIIGAAPLQTYSSALIFSPTNCLIRNIFHNEEPEWIRIKPMVEDSWGNCLQTIADIHGRQGTAVSPDGKLIASQTTRGIEIWATATWSVQKLLSDGRYSLRPRAFSHDSKLLATISSNVVKIFDIETGTIKQSLEMSEYFDGMYVSFSHDLGLMATNTREYTVDSTSHRRVFEIWDVEAGTLQRTGTGDREFSSFVFSHDSKLLASGSRYGCVEIWDAVEGAPQQTFKIDAPGVDNAIGSLAYSHDSKLLAAGSRSGTMKIWGVAEGIPKYTIKGGDGSIDSVAFSHDSKLLASGSAGGTVRIYDAATGTLRQTLKDNSIVTCLCFYDNSRLLASVTYESTKVWDISATNTSPKSLRHHERYIAELKFSHNSNILTSISSSCSNSDENIKIWDATTGQLLKTIRGGNKSDKIVFSPDSTILLSSSPNLIRLWDTTNWTLKNELQKKQDIGLYRTHFKVVTFSDDSSLLAIVSDNRTIEIRDTESLSVWKAIKWDRQYPGLMKFDETNRYLDTNVGRIRLADWTVDEQIKFRHTDMEIASVVYRKRHELLDSFFSWGLRRDKAWITWNGRNALWIPPDYRPSPTAASYVQSPSTDSAIVKVALGSSSGTIALLGLSDSGPTV
ncbi:WD40 repeat-like protein [Camillea tinctor]|nr:WD40 repeat-like protein [Camillea tinctor]